MCSRERGSDAALKVIGGDWPTDEWSSLGRLIVPPRCNTESNNETSKAAHCLLVLMK